MFNAAIDASEKSFFERWVNQFVLKKERLEAGGQIRWNVLPTTEERAIMRKFTGSDVHGARLIMYEGDLRVGPARRGDACCQDFRIESSKKW